MTDMCYFYTGFPPIWEFLGTELAGKARMLAEYGDLPLETDICSIRERILTRSIQLISDINDLVWKHVPSDGPSHDDFGLSDAIQVISDTL